MTDTPITTPAEALEAAIKAVDALETGYHDGISGDWHPYAAHTVVTMAAAAIRALASRIDSPVATVGACPHCGRDSHSDSKVVE